MLIIAAIFYTGCSLCSQPTKTVIVEPTPFKFVPIEVNLTEVEEVKKIDLKGKLKFLDDRNLSVVMDVNTWVKIRRAKRDESFANRRLRLQKKILFKALDGNLKQIYRYKELHSGKSKR